MSVNTLIDQIIEKRKEYLRQKIQRYPVNNFRASDIHECDRYLVYSILNWKEKSLHDEGLQAIFDRGNKEEKEVTKDLLELGYQIIESQSPFEIKNRQGEVICRGHIDGKIQFEGKYYPVEIKSTNVNTFNSIKDVEDLHRKPLHRKYLRQLQLYLFGHNCEEGLFIFSDLQGHYKLIPVYLDYGECELILQRLERCWELKKIAQLPDVKYNDQLCDKCSFAHICLPDQNIKGAKMIDSPELEEKLRRLEELKPLAAEYKEIDEDVKQPFKDAEVSMDIVVGTNYRIFSKKITENKVNLDLMTDEDRKKYTEPKTKTITKIINLTVEQKKAS